jgi:hypothetical protein
MSVTATLSPPVQNGLDILSWDKTQPSPVLGAEAMSSGISLAKSVVFTSAFQSSQHLVPGTLLFPKDYENE